MLQKNIYSHQDISYFVTQLFELAIAKNASDIHFEPRKEELKIRLRIHGLLIDFYSLTRSTIEPIITQLKIRAQLDIAEKRLPQDGRFNVNTKLDKINCRISTINTIHGEKIVLRILKSQKNLLSIDQLGFNYQQQQIFTKNINKKQGLILITGPTGSGKSTTMYAALSTLAQQQKNIISIEDPAEIEIDGINQININPKINLSADKILNASLRQDPDVIMVGEIRDPMLAEIAVQAAQTGHLVFATLHTTSAAQALNRLAFLGIPNIYLAETLLMIIAQRLVKTLCQECKKSANKSQAGCPKCIAGYSGRIALYEFLLCNKKIKCLIAEQATSEHIIQYANITTLQQAVIKKFINQQISLKEALELC